MDYKILEIVVGVMVGTVIGYAAREISKKFMYKFKKGK
jgi:hypothetical protein